MHDRRVRQIISCEDDNWRRRQLELANALNVVGKTPWRQTMLASLNEHGQLEIDAYADHSQWMSRNNGVTCSYREDRRISLAAVLVSWVQIFHHIMQ